MPIWVPILAVALALLLVPPLGDYIGLNPTVTVAVAAMMVTSATMVLVLGWLIPWLEPAQPRPAAWVAWLFLLASPALSALIIVGGAIRDGRAAQPAPVGSCRRCGTALFADHTGRRHFDVAAGYLCPPPLRQPGDRRHRLVRADHGRRADRT